MGFYARALVASLALAACGPGAHAPTAVTTGAGERSLRAPEAKSAPREVDPPLARPVADQPGCEPLATELPAIAEGPDDPPVPPLVDFGRDTMAGFYERAAAVLRGRARDHVRIAVFGDSNMTMDFITGEMRRVLQTRYGDAGHGFVAAGKPWSHYKHMDVRHGTKQGMASYACSTTPTGDHSYGLPCIVAEATGPGGRSFFETAEPGAPVGGAVDRFDIFYLRRKGFGTFDVQVDGATVRTVDSAADAESLGFERVGVPDGPHRLELVSKRGHVRLIGAALERGERPSFLVDSFGVGAMNTKSMGRRGYELVRAMYEKRPYDLIVYMTGANDVFTMDAVAPVMAETIALERRTLPRVAILIVTPADRGRQRSWPYTLRVVEQRAEIARDNHTAFWSLWEAMGGLDSMSRFLVRELAIPDGAHFNQAGGAWAGDRLLHAIWHDFAAYLVLHPDAGCSPEAERAVVVAP